MTFLYLFIGIGGFRNGIEQARNLIDRIEIDDLGNNLATHGIEGYFGKFH